MTDNPYPKGPPKRHLSLWLTILLWLCVMYLGIWVHDLIWHRS